MPAMGRVEISAVLGDVHCVSLVPPEPAMPHSQHLASYCEAVGFAVYQAASLGRQPIDLTGQLSAGELLLLVGAFALDGTGIALRDAARAERG